MFCSGIILITLQGRGSSETCRGAGRMTTAAERRSSEVVGRRPTRAELAGEGERARDEEEAHAAEAGSSAAARPW